MAEREIDRFRCKPSGVFASWQYGRVLIDDNGNVRHDDVPGENGFGRQCVSDYNKNDRRFGPGNLMTEFCNIETHTNYRVYAQDCRPFAYVQTDLNAAKCGYVVPPDPTDPPPVDPVDPLPSPFDPPNPFGTAKYGEYKYFSACDDKNVPVELKIFKRNYNGVASNLDYAGASPIVISWKNIDDDKFSPIRGCDVSITLISTVDFNLQQFYTEDEREYRIEIYKAGNLKFKGFLIPSDAREDFTAAPYEVTLRATDGIGSLKKIAYPVPVGSSIDILQSFLEIIAYSLSRTNLDLNIVTGCNLYEISMPNAIDNDPLLMAKVNPLRMSETGKIMDCYQVLENVCRQFSAFIVQDNGEWKFIRQSELSNSVIRVRRYTHKGFFLNSEQFYNQRYASCISDDISILNDSPILRIGSAYKRVEVKTEFGEVPAIIYNGDFELFDGQNFNYWTKYGGIDVSQIERTIKTTTGDILTGNHALRFNQKADSGKYLQGSPISAFAKDKLKISFNVSKTPDTQTQISPKPAYLFKMRLKLGQYYLANKNEGFEWVTQLAIVTHFVENHLGDINNYTVSFDIPELPIDEDLIIQLYGFQKIIQQSGRTGTGAGSRPGGGDTNAGVEYVEVNEYLPISIDNLSISKSKSEDRTKIDSVLHISQQDGFYTKVPDQIKLLFGDYTDQVVSSPTGTVTTGGRPSRADGTPATSTSLFNDMYAITYNGKYTTGWYEYGQSASGLPIGLMAAKSIMKAYQRPFRFLNSSFFGDNFSYLDVFNVQLPNNQSFGERTFSLLSGDYDLFRNELRNANYAEIFAKPAKTVDVTIPSYPGDISPPIIQNPNPTPQEIVGIFTEQFKQEFL